MKKAKKKKMINPLIEETLTGFELAPSEAIVMRLNSIVRLMRETYGKKQYAEIGILFMEMNRALQELKNRKVSVVESNGRYMIAK